MSIVSIWPVQQLRRRPLTWLCLGIIAGLLFAALAAPLLTPRAAEGLGEPNPANKLLPPSSEYIFGTDHLGRDLFARVMFGGQSSLAMGLIVVASAFGMGALLGLIAGYSGGWPDEIIMRIIDVLLAFPGILLNIAIAALVPRAGMGVLIFALAVNGWVGYARVTRAQVLRVREMEYVLAARALGVGSWQIMRRHILPNILSPILVQATFGAAGVVLVEAGLSFLGLGPPIPYTWGALLSQGTTYYWRARHLLVVPGVAIGLLVLGCNLLGDGLRDYMDPKSGAK
jgi:peptide/nickel transport system permease protein